MNDILEKGDIEIIEKQMQGGEDNIKAKNLAFLVGSSIGHLDLIEPWQEEFPLDKIMSFVETFIMDAPD
ncbi:hypothetical protein IID04_07695 [PVC group bacterium]|nr:hypothetical protein [PVC group bacterium]